MGSDCASKIVLLGNQRGRTLYHLYQLLVAQDRWFVKPCPVFVGLREILCRLLQNCRPKYCIKDSMNRQNHSLQLILYKNEVEEDLASAPQTGDAFQSIRRSHNRRRNNSA